MECTWLRGKVTDKQQVTLWGSTAYNTFSKLSWNQPGTILLSLQCKGCYCVSKPGIYKPMPNISSVIWLVSSRCENLPIVSNTKQIINRTRLTRQFEHNYQKGSRIPSKSLPQCNSFLWFYICPQQLLSLLKYKMSSSYS